MLCLFAVSSVCILRFRIGDIIGRAVEFLIIGYGDTGIVALQRSAADSHGTGYQR